jgi:hypothetical protein
MSSVLRLQQMNSLRCAIPAAETDQMLISGVSTICPSQFGDDSAFQLQ